MTDDRAAARETFCRLLAACYYELGPEFAEERVFPTLHDAASRIDPELAAHAGRLGEAFAGEGTVDLNWAKEHHSLWLEDELARTGPGRSQRQPMATPAE